MMQTDTRCRAVCLNRISMKIKKGRYRHPRLKGIDHGMAKLSEAQVLEIRGSRARLRDISSRYGIGLSQASRLRNGQGWKHLP
jgi:hypothetical protein